MESEIWSDFFFPNFQYERQLLPEKEKKNVKWAQDKESSPYNREREMQQSYERLAVNAPRKSSSREKLCRYFKRGNCRYGKLCHFSHKRRPGSPEEKNCGGGPIAQGKVITAAALRGENSWGEDTTSVESRSSSSSSSSSSDSSLSNSARNGDKGVDESQFDDADTRTVAQSLSEVSCFQDAMPTKWGDH
jgi:hypothetical protein